MTCDRLVTGSQSEFPTASGVVPDSAGPRYRRRFLMTELLFSFVMWGPFVKSKTWSCFLVSLVS